MATAATFTEYSFAQFAEIRNRKELCDFAFEVDGKSYFAHKVVLAASIPYFEQLFDGSGCHDDDEDNSAAPISPSNEVLETLLTFAYSGLKPEASAVATENFLPPMVGDADLEALLQQRELLETLLTFAYSGLKPEASAVATEDFLPSMVGNTDLEALLQQRFAKFDHFRRSEKLCDFTFMIKDTVFSAHKIILATSIPLFADLFLRPDQSNVLDYTVLNRLSPRAVRTLLQFAYSGEFNPTSAMQEEEGNDLRGVILAAKLFQVQKLEEMCLDFLRQRLNADVVQQYWPFAHANDLFELQEMLKSYMCANFQEFIGTQAFLALKTAELEDLLVRDDLSVTSEDDVFRAIVSWVDNAGTYRPSSTRNIASTGRAEAFPRLFSRLRICKLSEDCREQILSHPLCKAHFDCA
ncbi:unnamed protein product [Dibothriocephalus latus]|uniref:BTB domain-containing protein n=1 Tax=Dibothriocephalus latus TaxID=60516 RepID=A0A3P7M0H5_DIBLA|nr:unnamed protein product [Dibothriocephalus latus]